MSHHLACLAFALLALGCAKSPEPVAVAAAPELAATAPAKHVHALSGVFGACQMGCRFDFRELEGDKPRVTQTYHRDGPELRFEGVLTPAGREQLTKLGAMLANANLEATYGCGVCVDGSDNKLVLEHADGRVTEHSYDAQYPQGPALQAVDPLLQRIESSFYTCTSNELIELGAECVPYEKLSPRPYSRP